MVSEVSLQVVLLAAVHLFALLFRSHLEQVFQELLKVLTTVSLTDNQEEAVDP